MNFKEKLLQLSERVANQKDKTMTEEGTKVAFVLPFLQVLGYDIFNPDEVEPEHICDIGIKKGEKIDYAIKCNGEPILLIECKHGDQDLALHINQLFRYYVTSKARLAILTNGIQYKFFSDVERTNVMDMIPFLEVDITNINEYQIEQLKKFHKSYFNEQYICETIPSIKYIKEILTTHVTEKMCLENELASLHVGYEQMLEDASHMLEQTQHKLDTCSQRVAELENDLHIREEVLHEGDDELNALVDYLNMPVPYNWQKMTLPERKAYWGVGRAMWHGKPRDVICSQAVAREFYNYDKKGITSGTGRKITEEIKRTGLFERDGSKKSFEEYGSAIAWYRIDAKKAVKTTIKKSKKL